MSTHVQICVCVLCFMVQAGPDQGVAHVALGFICIGRLYPLAFEDYTYGSIV